MKEEVWVLQNGFRTATILLMVLVFTIPAFAVENTGKIGFGVRGGGFISGGEWKLGPMFGADLKFGIHKNWSIGLTGMYGPTKGGMLEMDNNNVQMIVSTDEDADKLRIRHHVVEMAGWFNITPDAEKLNLYLMAGAGIDTWHTEYDGGDKVYVFDTSGVESFRYRDQQLALVIGGGLEYFLIEEFSIGAGLRYHILTNALSQFKDERDVGDNLDNPSGLLEIGATLTAYLGSCKDSDKDGVCDEDDKCPETPKGCIVDEAGCPLDGDGDGVCDGLDQCPDTPRGCKVDMNGCLIDSDGDGVCDGIDKCPDTPTIAKVDADGCPLDTDRDGVPDYRDKCPDTPYGCKVDENGCEIDSDGDGVCDGLDKCPGTPAGLKVDKDGCPVDFIIEKEQVLEPIIFAVNSAKLTKQSRSTIDAMIEKLKAISHVRIEVQGHTDVSGTHKWNMELSQMRAQSVVDYMVEKGIDVSRLVPKGYGPDKPKYDNKVAEGRRNNRRVEVIRLN